MSEFTPKHFTKDNPCTKVDLHNCFYRGGRYVNRPVVEAKTEIGENAPKYLIRENLVVVREIAGVDTYVLTPEGDSWLRTGILRYLALHPERAKDCKFPPPGYRSVAPQVRRTRPSAAPVSPPPRAIVRRRKV